MQCYLSIYLPIYVSMDLFISLFDIMNSRGVLEKGRRVSCHSKVGISRKGEKSPNATPFKTA